MCNYTDINYNPFTPTVKPQVTQSLVVFDSMGRHLKCDHSLESHRAALNYAAAWFFNFPKFSILKNLTI